MKKTAQSTCTLSRITLLGVSLYASFLCTPAYAHLQTPDEVRKIDIRLRAVRNTVNNLPRVAHGGTWSCLLYRDNAHNSRVGWNPIYTRDMAFYYVPPQGSPLTELGTLVYGTFEQNVNEEWEAWKILYHPSGDPQYVEYDSASLVIAVYFNAHGDIMRYLENEEERESPREWTRRVRIERFAHESRKLFQTLRQLQLPTE